MAHLFSDSFDMYATVSDLTLRGWASTYSAGSLVTGANTAFGVGQGYSTLTNGNFATANFETGTNETTVYVSLRFKTASVFATGATFSLGLRDGISATSQVTCVWNCQTGAIEIRSGSATGTLIQSIPAAFAAGSWDSYQLKFVINNTTGTVEVRKNGSVTPLATPVAGNTRATTTNSFVNAFVIALGPTNSTMQVDDLFFNSDNGAAPTTWPGDVRLLWSTAASSVQSQFSVLPNNVATSAMTGSNNVTIPNTATYFVPVVAASTGVLASLVLFNLSAGVTGLANMAIYDNTGVSGGPGTLLGTANQVTNPTAGGGNVFTVTGGPTLIKGNTYYVAVKGSVTIVPTGANTNIWTLASTYAAGVFPSTAAGFVFSAANFLPGITINVSPAPWFVISDATEDGDSSFITSATVGNKDIVTTAGLGTINPSAIIGVKPVVMWRKSDSGPRTATIGVDANGSGDTAEIVGITPSLSYNWSSKFMPLDPTGAVWLTANVNSLKLSATVAS